MWLMVICVFGFVFCVGFFVVVVLVVCFFGVIMLLCNIICFVVPI